MVNKIEIINPRIIFINYIDTPPDPNSTNMLVVTDSGANIHLSRQATLTMSTVILENEMEARLPDGITV